MCAPFRAKSGHVKNGYKPMTYKSRYNHDNNHNSYYFHLTLSIIRNENNCFLMKGAVLYDNSASKTLSYFNQRNDLYLYHFLRKPDLLAH